jgi:regulatory protein
MTKTSYNYSIQLLSKKDYSSFKLRKKLRQKEYEDLEIAETLDKLTDLKYLNDVEYRRDLISSLLRRSYENRYITQKLAQEELITDDNEINEIKIEIGYNTNSELLKLINLKMKHSPPPETPEEKFKVKSRLASFLSSKGFQFDDINEEINKRLSYED